MVDVVAAIIAALAISSLEFLNIPQFLRASLLPVVVQGALIKTAAFILSALFLIVWRYRWRRRWGWIVIATLGTLLAAGIDEFRYRRSTSEPDFFVGLSPFPMEIILFLLPALLVMAGAHFLGIFLQNRFQKSVG